MQRSVDDWQMYAYVWHRYALARGIQSMSELEVGVLERWSAGARGTYGTDNSKQILGHARAYYSCMQHSVDDWRVFAYVWHRYTLARSIHSMWQLEVGVME
jgi:hypothetical protein